MSLLLLQEQDMTSDLSFFLICVQFPIIKVPNNLEKRKDTH